MSSPFDPSKKFIRIVEQRANGMVEFEFAVGEPELFVEMLLPQAAFEGFCTAQGVSPEPARAQPEPGDVHDPSSVEEQARHDMTWTLHDASRHRL